MANISFDFTFTGEQTREIVHSANINSMSNSLAIMPSIKSLEQYIVDNPYNFRGFTEEASKTSCAVEAKEIPFPTNITPKVVEFDIRAKRCVRDLSYDSNGDYTHYQDKRNTGMSGFSQYGGRDQTVLGLLTNGMGDDNYHRVWFSNSANSQPFLSTSLSGIWTKLLSNSSSAGTPAVYQQVYRGSDLPDNLDVTSVVSGFRDLYENSRIELRQMMASMLVYRCTTNIYYLLMNHYEQVTGSDKNWSYLQEGQRLVLRYRNIEVVPEYGWDTSLSGEGVRTNDLSTSTNSLLLLTERRNLWALTDDPSDTTKLQTWLEKKDRSVYYDGNYMLGSFIIDYNLTSFVKQEITP